MILLHRLVSIVRWIARRTRAEAELDDEMQHFVEMAAADHRRDGLTPANARRLALMQLGGIEHAKEQVRTGRHGAWLDDLARDVRYAVRLAIRNPGFSAVVVLTLALGIGANTAIFSLIDALLLRSLPVRDPQQLVQVRMGDASRPDVHFSYAIARALADRHDVFSTAAGFSVRSFNVGPPGSVGRVSGACVTGAYYETLGLTPVTGRLLMPSDDQPGAPLVAVISHGYWERQFGGRPDVVGEKLTIGGLPVTIVGVSPRGFVGATVGEIANITMAAATIPMVEPDAARLLERGNFWLRVLARPAAGVSIAQATTRLNAWWPQAWDSLIAPQWPAPLRKTMADAVFELSAGSAGWTSLRDQYTKPLTVLMGAVALVLLIACGNVASLLLARASVRQHEIVLRLAIGAGRARIVRQLLIESSLLSVTGTLLGLVLAWLSGRVIVSLISTGSREVLLDLTPNGHILGFAALLAIATGMAFGTAPALKAAHAAPSSALKSDSRTSASPSRLLSPLVTGQVALTLILLIVAGLFVRTLQNLEAIDKGFTSDGVFVVDLEARRTGVPAGLLDEVRRIPGVVAASVSTHTPLSGATWSEPTAPMGRQLPERDNSLFVGAAPGLFATMQIPLLAGRDFSESDTGDRPSVAVVNQAFAQRGFPNQNPVGQHIVAAVRGEEKDLEIVGLVENTYTIGLRLVPRATVYVAYTQLRGSVPTTITVQTDGPLIQTSGAIQRAVQARLPNAPIEVRPLSAQVNGAMARERMLATLASGFGVLALVLACVGIYGLQAYGVARRIKEIGIRLALGAERRRVVALVLGRAAKLVFIGVGIGLPVAFAASRWIESLLFGLQPTDFTTLASAIVLLALTTQFAASVPAWKASRVDPLAALRHD